MNWHKRLFSVGLSVLMMVGILSGCSGDEEAPVAPVNTNAVRLAVSNGPMAISAVNLWSEQDTGTTKNKYTISLQEEANAANALKDGKADMAILSPEKAAQLYSQTGGKVQVLAGGNLSWLHIMETTSEIWEVADLKGKTIHMVGKATAAEYILRYVLTQNGLTPDKDVTIAFATSYEELSGMLRDGQISVAMMAEPYVTTLKMKKPKIRVAFNMADVWPVAEGSRNTLLMSCVVANKDFVTNNPETVKTFLYEYEASVSRADAIREETATLCVKYKLSESKAIAEESIMRCGFFFTSGERLKASMTQYLQVLEQGNTQLIGGTLPGDGFYYISAGQKA